MSDPNLDLSNIDPEALEAAKALAGDMSPEALQGLLGSTEVQDMLPDEVKSALAETSAEDLQKAASEFASDESE